MTLRPGARTLDRDGWRAPAEPLALATGEVHVWRVPSARSPRDVERWAVHASSAEHEAASRKHFARDRDEVLVSHGALRVIVARYLATRPEGLEFAAGEHGKPALHPDPARLAFNLSHSGGSVLIGVARALEIGVDVERLDRVRPDDDLAPRVLSDRELALWRDVPAAQRDVLFLRMWTAKEAVLKASGAGLSIEPQTFEVLERDPATSAARIAASARLPGGARYAVRELDFGAGCAAALAVAGAPTSLDRFDLPFAWAG